MLNGLGSPKQIQAAQQSIAAHGVKVGYHGADLSKPEEIQELLKSTEHLLGTVDVLVNNAGIQHVCPVDTFDPVKWDAILAINLSAAFHTTRGVLPGMKTRNWGRIVNIASAHGLVASANKSAYVAAKHGLVGLTKAVALELATTGITCNAVCPGWVLTPLVQAQVDTRAKNEGTTVELAKVNLLSEKQPSQEFVTPAQLGGLVAFLCSEDANEVRGAAWNMDGGWLAQ
jgi:3-hydroxybutyrate dehydrogenase